MKRALDIILSLIAIICLSPVFLIIWVKIRLALGSPVLFTQPRVGQSCAVFHLKKFRSMTSAMDVHGNLLPDEKRLTAFGLKLRSSSLDELPTLYNVLIGDMSIVGPRPLLVEYLPLYSPEQIKRHNVAPGITGWAQVNGRNALSWDEKFRLDVWYVKNRTLWLDVKIIVLTIWKVIKKEGIAHDGMATMSKFTGPDDGI